MPTPNSHRTIPVFNDGGNVPPSSDDPNYRRGLLDAQSEPRERVSPDNGEITEFELMECLSGWMEP
ncbi:hypothetical protein N7457_006175 [Penicillium paradoxum]|uniref:uncharacterized protein n=1 Tax=Penicillium paradoxum TaxID=176176 RepID=UPI0025481958|nr:uncharacterized protein N7457_006175 [Penicillium paradoxum]KAJ5781015.1 hypothetical protein N7457_006175 [Penicillium paradoxum]